MQALCPDAFTHPLALAVVPAGEGPAVTETFRALGVWHTPVPHAAVRRWFPALRLPADADLLRVCDAVIDLRLLAHALAVRARRAGSEPIVAVRAEDLQTLAALLNVAADEVRRRIGDVVTASATA